jgi:ribosomal protein L11 methyltransferase
MLLDLPVPQPRFSVNAPGIVDLGCGSGVLAILAAKLGWPNVLALDYDPLAVAATAENARVNGVELWAVRRFDLRHEDAPRSPVVLANLLAPLLLTWCERMAAMGDVKRPHTVIASGLLTGEADRIAAAFAGLGYAEADRRIQGDWAALLLRGPVLYP